MLDFKENDSLNKENYRPIILFSHTSKTFEEILFNQINHYIEPYFSDFLKSLRISHSTQQHLLKMSEKLKHLLDNVYNIGVFFMDLLKAFNVLNHSLLLAKSDAYGFSLKSTIFIQRYLNKSMQKVIVNNNFSLWKDIYGVSQGSMPGRFLSNNFIIYISSFSTTCDMCNCADDNALYAYSRDFHQVQEYLKKALEISVNWTCDNYMVLNFRKSEFMNFGKINETEVFTYHEIRLKKILLRNYLVLQ